MGTRAVAAALVLVAFVLISCTREELPSWVTWHASDFTCDVVGMAGEGQVRIRDRMAEFYAGDRLLCTSLDEWRVQDGLATDVDRDGVREVVLICWRQANFGPSHPFWVNEEEDEPWSQHLFILRPEQDEAGQTSLVGVWMTSALDLEVASVEDEAGRLRLHHPDGGSTLWEWGTWGLQLVEEPTVVVTGDIICHDSVCAQMRDEAHGTFDFDPLFEHVREFVSAQDLALACQETVLVSDAALIGTYPSFGTSTELGDALVRAGYDVVCAATNHVADKGEAGIAQTLAFWRERHPDIRVLGLHEGPDEPAVRTIEVCGYRLALLNATDGLEAVKTGLGYACSVDTLDERERLLDEVRHAQGTADVTVCVLHLGDEYEREPDARTREVVCSFVDAGADVVVVSHAHVLGGCERLEGTDGHAGVVYWCLGNLVSHQMEPETVLGGAARILISRDEHGRAYVRDFDLVPTVCHFDAEHTSAYLLDDYSSELARRHALNGWEQGLVTVEGLRAQYEQVRASGTASPRG